MYFLFVCIQAQARIIATQYDNDIDELQYQLQTIKMKMTAEIKVILSVLEAEALKDNSGRQIVAGKD